MAVFALENGRLVSAPGHPNLDPAESHELLGAVRQEAIGLLDHQLFEVGWYRSDGRDRNQDSLLALDPTGQIVTIEVHETVDAQTLLAALARAGRYADFSRSQLSAMYAGGERAFASGWANFLEASSPMTRGGPRLVLFTTQTSHDVLAPLAALNGSGVEAHHILVHSGANGVLVELARIGHRPMGILSSGARRVELEASDQPVPAQPAPAQPAPAQPAPSPNPVPTQAGVAKQRATSASDNARNSDVDDHEQSIANDDERARNDSGSGIDSRLWNITGWNSAQVPRPQPYRPPVEPEPINPVKNPVFAEMARESDKSKDADLPELDPDTLAEFEATRAEKDERTDTAIMLAEMSSAQNSSGTADAKRVPHWSKVSDVLNGSSGTAPTEQSAASMYEDLVRESQRPEQRIWEDSAPTSSMTPTLIDERDSARYSQEAVARAAADADSMNSLPAFAASAMSAPFLDKPAGWRPPEPTPSGDPLPELVRLARDLGAPAEISWISARKGINVRATLTSEGFIETASGQRFIDPQAAAEAIADGKLHDGWRVWQLADGRRLSDFRQ